QRESVDIPPTHSEERAAADSRSGTGSIAAVERAAADLPGQVAMPESVGERDRDVEVQSGGAIDEDAAGKGTDVAQAANEAATSPANDLKDPSPAQREATNYRVGRMRINGHEISIEYPAGVKRKASHRKKLRHAYGYIRRTE